MAFNGSLKEMSLDGVLQLIQFQQSSGIFTLKRPGVVAQVFFHQGFLQGICLESSFWENKIRHFLAELEVPRFDENFIRDDLLKNFKECLQNQLIDEKTCLKALKYFQTEIFC